MRRDWKLIRRLLEYVESKENGGIEIPHVDGYTPETVAYHVRLCVEAKFFHAQELIPDGHMIERMTWAGHEALQKLREDG